MPVVQIARPMGKARAILAYMVSHHPPPHVEDSTLLMVIIEKLPRCLRGTPPQGTSIEAKVVGHITQGFYQLTRGVGGRCSDEDKGTQAGYARSLALTPRYAKRAIHSIRLSNDALATPTDPSSE